jgi:uncharacterized protein
MRTTGQSAYPGRPAKRLMLRMSVHDHVRHRSLEMEILKHARRSKMAGATVFEGAEGFGRSGRVHEEHLLSDDRPLTIVMVDEPAKIDTFLEENSGLFEGVLAIVEEIEILDL